MNQLYTITSESVQKKEEKIVKVVIFFTWIFAMFLKNKKPDIGVYKIDLTALNGYAL